VGNLARMSIASMLLVIVDRLQQMHHYHALVDTGQIKERDCKDDDSASV